MVVVAEAGETLSQEMVAQAIAAAVAVAVEPYRSRLVRLIAPLAQAARAETGMSSSYQCKENQ